MMMFVADYMKLLWIFDFRSSWDSSYWISLNLIDFFMLLEVALKRATKPLYEQRVTRGTLSFYPVPKYS
jgi:hypothetical protein